MRPLLVLVLVLGAIAALLFAVFSLDQGKPKQPDLVSRDAVDSPAKGPAVPVSLEGAKDPTRSTAPTVASERTPSGGPANGKYAFDNKLTGLVKNLQGQPVAGADVSVTTFGADEMTFVDDLPDPTKEPHARTDADGRYTFLAVTPRERYMLVVVHPDYARKTEPSMPIGEEGQVDQPPIVLGAGATLSGYVRNEPGDVIPDVTLHLDGQDFASVLTNLPPDRMTVKTNKEGFYTFRNVAKGQRMLTVAAPGYGQQQLPGFNFQGEEQLTRDVTLKIGEMIAGRVLGPGNTGIAKARVIAIAVSSTQQGARGQVETNEQGEFIFESLAPGDYNVIAAAKGYRAGQGGRRVPTGTSNHIIEMFKEADVCGRVIDGSTGAPIPSFTVRMRFWYGNGAPTSPSSEAGIDVNDAAGEFCIPGVQQSDYVVEALAPGYAPSFSTNFSVQQGKPLSGIVVKMNRGGIISGRVVDGDGKPVARARVVTHDNTWIDDEFTRALGGTLPTDATSVDVRTGEDGRFTCVNLSPETYQIVVTASGFTQFVKKDIRVNDAGNVQVGDVKLGRGGTVRGNLFDASGKPVSSGVITLQVTDGEYQRYTTKSGTDGKFALANVGPGRYLLTGSRGGGGDPFGEIMNVRESQVMVIVAEGDVTTQDLRLSD